MGGEPTIHPHFHKFIAYAQEKFPFVHIFTNAINENIRSVNLRENDSIVYNFTFSKFINANQLLLDKPGKRALEVQIGVLTPTETIMSEIERVCSISPNRLFCVLTLDCTENIFKNKEVLKTKYLEVWNYCCDNEILLYQDHKIPLCWLAGTNIPMVFNTSSLCSMQCAGLIDAQGNLKHCNQFPDTLINIFQDGKLLPYEIICNYLRSAHYKIEGISLDKICKSCILFGEQCNGGCFIAKQNISASDIVHNSVFPT